MTKPAPKEWILGISPYVPGKAAADDGRPLIKLSANENPLGTGEAARAALIAATADLATYPDPGASASWSQSIRMSRTSSMLPEVSPFFHKDWRLRDQKWANPVSIVSASA